MRHTLLSLALFGATASLATAQTSKVLNLIQSSQVDPKKKDEKKKDEKKDEQPVPPVTLPATAAPNLAPVAQAGTQVQVSSLPPVYGDLLMLPTFSPYLRAQPPEGAIQTIQPGQVATFPIGTEFDRPVQTQIVRVQTGTTVILIPNPDGQPIRVVVPVFEDRIQVTGTAPTSNLNGIPVNVARGAFVIYENESPRPTDRVYLNYNYFSNVNPTLQVPGLPQANVHRETFGLEKTFLGGDASIGFRLPLLQMTGPTDFAQQGLGDLTMILKFAAINDYNRNPDGSLSPGNVLSGGVAVTAPTAGAIAYSAFNPVVHSTLIQPWVGGILVRGDWFTQGFFSAGIPTDSTDTTFLFTALQVGYMLLQAPAESTRLITSVSPIAEIHVITPLNNRNYIGLPVGACDIVSCTGGVTLGLGSRSGLNLGVNVPVTGPKPYDIEAIAQFNFRY